MTQTAHTQLYSGSAAENYERYFVPAIGAPLAADLIETADLRPGERVLDVACGTGIVARLAAASVGESGCLTGTDVNPDMLEVARAVADGMPIDWHQADAESLPQPEASFDVVLCQMGLQFVPNKLAALREMRRVLVPGGRTVLNLPGPTPEPMAAFADALARHVDPKLASFVHLVFSLYETSEVREMMDSADFVDIDIRSATKELSVPPPRQFMWEYIHSTPLGTALVGLDEKRRAALERDVCTQWQRHSDNGSMTLRVGMTTATAKRA